MTVPSGVLRTAMGTYVLQEDTHLSRQVEEQHRLDTGENIAEIASFAHLIPEGGAVVDAGACLGDHTVSYSQIVGPIGRVYALEPHPLAYEALVLNTARLNNVTAFRVGLSDRSGKAWFILDSNIGASFISDDGDIQIEVRTLDEFLLPQLRRCDFLHLDAEGLELRILQGGRALIARFHPVMVVEVCDHHLQRAGSSEAELLELLDKLGYHVVPIQGHNDPSLRDVLAVWG